MDEFEFRILWVLKNLSRSMLYATSDVRGRHGFPLWSRACMSEEELLDSKTLPRVEFASEEIETLNQLYVRFYTSKPINSSMVACTLSIGTWETFVFGL